MKITGVSEVYQISQQAQGVNVKRFYLLLYSVTLGTILHSSVRYFTLYPCEYTQIQPPDILTMSCL